MGDVAFGLEVDLGFAVSARQWLVDLPLSICYTVALCWPTAWRDSPTLAYSGRFLEDSRP